MNDKQPTIEDLQKRIKKLEKDVKHLIICLDKLLFTLKL